MILTPEQQLAIVRWHAAMQAAAAAKLVIEAEQKARKELIATLNLSMDEGAHTLNLPDDWKLRYKTPFVRVIDRRIVESLREPLRAQMVSIDSLIDWKPSLVTKEYRELTAEARAIFDTCLTTTAGLTMLELVSPKAKP